MEIMISTFVERHPQHELEVCILQFTMDYVVTDIGIEKSRDQGEESTEKRRVGLLYGSVELEKPNVDLTTAVVKLGK
ncbi:hypothetical protein ACF0H5_013054 [Mactra antiquata]